MQSYSLATTDSGTRTATQRQQSTTYRQDTHDTQRTFALSCIRTYSTHNDERRWPKCIYSHNDGNYKVIMVIFSDETVVQDLARCYGRAVPAANTVTWLTDSRHKKKNVFISPTANHVHWINALVADNVSCHLWPTLYAVIVGSWPSSVLQTSLDSRPITGHQQWATHVAVAQCNAAPHTDAGSTTIAFIQSSH